MCDPITAGVATFAQGAIGAVGSHQSAQAQADYQNEVAQREYNYNNQRQKLDWQNQLGIWAQKRLEYKQGVDENFSASDRAFASEQAQMNEQFQQALFQKQDMMQQLVGLRGTNAASERSGRSVQRLDTAAVGAFGRNNAVIAANLTSAQGAMRQRLYDNSLQLQAANQRAYNQVIIPPQKPMAVPQPMAVPGPSGSSLALGIAGAALGGFGTYASMKAPKGFEPPKAQTFTAPSGKPYYGPAFGVDWKYNPTNTFGL